MRPQEDPGINPNDGKSVDNEAKRNQKRKDGLIFMNVGEDQVFANKSRRNRKSRYTQTAKQKEKGDVRMFVGVPVKLIKVDAAFMILKPAKAQETQDPGDRNATKVKMNLLEFKILIERDCQGYPKVRHDNEQPTHASVRSLSK